MTDYLIDNPNPPTIKNVAWLDSFYFPLPQRFATIRYKDDIWAPPLTVKFLKQKFLFNVLQATKNEVAVYINRVNVNPDPEPDRGYFLHFMVSIVGLDEPVKNVAMHYDDGIVRVLFWKRSILKALQYQGKDYYTFDLKVVIKLVELENLDNDERKRTVNFIRAAKENFSVETSFNMGLLLGRPDFEYYCTGRMDPLLNYKVICLILRTSSYSEEILKYLLSKKTGDLEPINFREILHYLKYQTEGLISDYDAMSLYVFARSAGLKYLTEFTCDYLMTQMDNKMLVVEILQIADHMQDRELFQRAAIRFLGFYQEIRQTAMYQNILNRTDWMVRSIFFSCRSFMKTKYTWIPGWTVYPETLENHERWN